jgi:hypothetical protein
MLQAGAQQIRKLARPSKVKIRRGWCELEIPKNTSNLAGVALNYITVAKHRYKAIIREN